MTVRRKFEERLEAVRSDLLGEAYQVDVRSRTRAAVASARVKFRGLLHELGLSPHDDEVFTIKVEIDTNPPAGARTESRLVRRFVMLLEKPRTRYRYDSRKRHEVVRGTFRERCKANDVLREQLDPDRGQGAVFHVPLLRQLLPLGGAAHLCL